MNTVAWTVAATLLLSATVAAKAAPAPSGAATATEAGVIYEWVDDSGRRQASDTVPDKYKSVARRIDADRSRIPAAQQADAERQAAALKARAASAVPVPAPRTTSAKVRTGTTRAASLNGSPTPPDTPECAEWRRQIVANRGCFIADGAGVLRSCANVPDPQPACAPEPAR